MPLFSFGLHSPEITIAQISDGILPVIENYQPLDVIKEVIAWAIIAAAVLCIVFIFIGGISFILSGGQDEKIKAAVGTIRYAIIGLVITILSVTMVNVVTYVFKIPFDFVSYSDIVAKVQNLGQIFQQDQGAGGGEWE